MDQRQIDEWAESPVTLALVAIVDRELAMIRASKQDAYHPGEPQKTQENLLTLVSSEGAWEDIRRMLAGEFEQDEEEDG